MFKSHECEGKIWFKSMQMWNKRVNECNEGTPWSKLHPAKCNGEGGERVSKGNNAMGCNANSNIPIILTILIQAPEKKTTSTSKSKAKKATTGVANNKTSTTKGKSEAAKARDEARCSFNIVFNMKTNSIIWSDQWFFLFSGKRCWKTESERWRKRKLGTKMTWWSSCSWSRRRWRWKWSKWSVREQKYLWSTKVLVNYQGGEFIQFSLKI